MNYRPPHIPNFERFAERLVKSAKERGRFAIQAFAGFEAETFRQRILEQQFESFEANPLSPAWIARKIAKNADLRVIVATQTYVKHIRVFTKENEDGSLTVYVGFDENDRAVDLDGNIVRDMPLHVLAEIHEYGSEVANIPPRPHFTPFREEMRQRAGKVRERIRKQVTLDMRGKE